MANIYHSGKEGTCRIDGGALLSVKTWSMDMKCVDVKVNNMLSGFQLVVDGLVSCDVQITGPYDNGGGPDPVVGTFVDFTFGVTDVLTITIPVLVTDIKLDDDVEDAPRYSISGTSNGAFTPQMP